jgi:hypothetical protein
MGKRKIADRAFWEVARRNNATFMQYYNRLMELSISMFEWKNLPETVDERFLELCLFAQGQAVFFKENDIGYLALQVATGGRLDVYRIPTQRRAYASNGFNADLDETNSVLIYNNRIHTNSMLDVKMFAERLANYDRVIDVNANAQKTPILIKCDEQQRLTLKNVYMQFDGNQPAIFADKNLAKDSLDVLTTNAPFIGDKMYQLKTQYWNEALTYLGISNINITKKERLITDEVTRNQGGTIASRYSRLETRREACKKINKMFGLNVWVDFREDFQTVDVDNDTIEGEPNSEGHGGKEEKITNE